MMGHQIARYLGWVFWLLDAAVIVAGIVMFAQAGGDNEGDALIGTLAMVVAFFAFPTMGALIIWQRPRNTIGWIFCLIGLGTATTSFSAAFIQRALATGTDGQLLAGLIDAVGNTIWPLNLGLGTFLLFLFPNGRLPSRRWRFIFWLDVGVVALAVLVGLFQPGYLESHNRVWNPLGITSARPLFDVINTIGGPVFVVCALASVAAIIVRYVTSHDIQRQQIKWFAFGVAAMVAILIPSFIFIPEQDTLSNITFGLGIIMLPLGAGIGILRYRLFDIDIIINRTLVYVPLTFSVIGLYVVLVNLVQPIIARTLDVSGESAVAPLGVSLFRS